MSEVPLYANSGWIPDSGVQHLKRAFVPATRGINLQRFKDFLPKPGPESGPGCLKNGSSQGRNLAVPILCVPSSLAGGGRWLNLRTTTLHKCAAVPRRARM